jgi:hypothetical protein
MKLTVSLVLLLAMVDWCLVAGGKETTPDYTRAIALAALAQTGIGLILLIATAITATMRKTWEQFVLRALVLFISGAYLFVQAVSMASV